MAAYGGLCRVDFLRNCDYTVTPIILNRERLNELQDHLMLYFTGFSRIASDIAREQIDRTPSKKQELGEMYRMVDDGMKILTSAGDIADFGQLLNESWKIKRNLTSKVSTPQIDEIYQRARTAGAIGGKLLGAGGGGFILLFVRPEDQPKVRLALKDILQVPFNLDNSGSQIISYQPEVLRPKVLR
jgi:D-glycero-alpha-D-manno-heptose-7-phosphate kinase